MKRAAIIFVGIVVTLLTLRALLNNTFFPIHDFTHVTRLVEMDKAIKDGEFPVRWSRDLGYGYGMPLFNFYGPMPFYLADVFHQLGLDSLWSIKGMLFVMAGVGFAGMFLLAAEYFGVAGGLIAATAFLTFPYRAVDLFVRGAFNEAFAISLIPFILYGIVRIAKTQTWRWVGITALLLMVFFASHNLMTLMFLPVVYLFSLLQLLFVQNKRQYVVQIHTALMMGVGAAAFYLLPSFFEKGWTQVDKLIGGYGAYTYHFLYIRQLFTEHWGYGGSILGLDDGLSFHLGWTHLVLGGIGTTLWLLKEKSKKMRLLVSFIVFVMLAALFMTIFKSQFVWDRVPLFVYFQFPWRFLSIPAVILPLLCGGVVFFFPSGVLRKVGVLIAVTTLLAMNLRFFQPEKLWNDPDVQYYEDAERIQSQMSDILPDYIPIWMKKIQAPFQVAYELQQEQEKKPSILVDKTQEKLLQFHLDEPDVLLIRIAWFPNWTVYDNGKKVGYLVDDTTGFFSVQLPEGDHLISIIFEDTVLRAWMNIVSICCVLAIVGMIAYGSHRYHRHSA